MRTALPRESPTSGTVSVTVSLPADAPFASVKVKRHAGSDAEITRSLLLEPLTKGDRESTEVVNRITWTAQPGVRVGPGEFEDFDIDVGPLPEAVGPLSFPATQTYEDGKVVVWDHPRGEGDEAEHPAPVLTLTAPAGDASAAPAAPRWPRSALRACSSACSGSGLPSPRR